MIFLAEKKFATESKNKKLFRISKRLFILFLLKTRFLKKLNKKL